MVIWRRSASELTLDPDLESCCEPLVWAVSDRAAVAQRLRCSADGDRRDATRFRQGFECKCQVRGRVKTLFGILLQAAMHDPPQAWRSGLDKLRNRGRVVVQDGSHRLGRGRLLESALAGQHFVEHCTGREDVAACVGNLSSHLLRRHVTDRSQHLSGSGLRSPRVGWVGVTGGFGRCELGQSEVENLHPPVFGQEDVFRLQVAMHDSGIVRRA